MIILASFFSEKKIAKKKKRKLKCVFSTSQENVTKTWIRKYSFKNDLVQGNFVVCYTHYRRKHSVKKAMLRYIYIYIFLTVTLLKFKFSGDKYLYKNREMPHDASLKESNFLKNYTIT